MFYEQKWVLAKIVLRIKKFAVSSTQNQAAKNQSKGTIYKMQNGNTEKAI